MAAAPADLGARAALVRACSERAVRPSDDPAVDRADVAAQQGANSRADGDADVNADDAAQLRADASPNHRTDRGAVRIADAAPVLLGRADGRADARAYAVHEEPQPGSHLSTVARADVASHRPAVRLSLAGALAAPDARAHGRADGAADGGPDDETHR